MKVFQIHRRSDRRAKKSIRLGWKLMDVHYDVPVLLQTAGSSSCFSAPVLRFRLGICCGELFECCCCRCLWFFIGELLSGVPPLFFSFSLLLIHFPTFVEFRRHCVIKGGKEGAWGSKQSGTSSTNGTLSMDFHFYLCELTKLHEQNEQSARERNNNTRRLSIKIPSRTRGAYRKHLITTVLTPAISQLILLKWVHLLLVLVVNMLISTAFRQF